MAMGFVLLHGVMQMERLRFLSAKSVMPTEVKELPGVRAREVLLPESSVDSMWWVMHTEAMLEGRADGARVRRTERDNAPTGREVHWSSSLVWMLAFLAWLIHWVTGLETVDCVQYAAVLFGPLTLLAFIGLLAPMVAQRWGYLAGGFTALGLATNGALMAFNRAGEADHHALVIGMALASLLALALGGAGWVARDEGGQAGERLTLRWRGARTWFVMSGVLGAAGLWISASTMLPVLLGVGISVVLMAVLTRWRKPEEEAGRIAAPALWRWWGVSGALGSAFFYLLEYAPSHFGWRLEVNHPLYALAFWGAGEVLAGVAAWGARQPLEGSKAVLGTRWGLAVLALAALPLVILWRGAEVFVVQDPFLWRLHHEHILEFRSLPKFIAASTWTKVIGSVSLWPLLVLPLLLGMLRWRLPRQAEALLLMPLGALIPLNLLACLEERWVWVTGVMWLALPLVGLAVWRAGQVSWPRPFLTGIGGVFLASLAAVPLMLPAPWKELDDKAISLDEAYAYTAREVAWMIRQQAGEKPLTVLSGPTSTTRLAFFADTKGVGTLYWENAPGLKAAAKIFAAQTEDEALTLFREHGITHLVLFSWDYFGESYARLHQGLPLDAPIQEPYLNRLLSQKSLPIWLRPLHFTIMPQLAQLGQSVDIFEFRPEQRPAESYYHVGKYLAAGGLQEEAVQAFAEAWKRDPKLPGVERDIGVSLALSGRVSEAQALAGRLNGKDRAPVVVAIARRLSAEGRHQEAIEAWRKSVELSPEETTPKLELAWLLATSEDATLRNGAEALRLVNEALQGRSPQNAREMDVLAAANAENGRFQEAIDWIDQALKLARSGAGPDVVKEFENRRSQYSSRQPFRTAKKMGG